MPPAPIDIKPFLGAQASTMCSLAGVVGGSTFRGSSIRSPGLLVSLSVHLSEGRAYVERIGRSAQSRR